MPEAQVSYACFPVHWRLWVVLACWLCWRPAPTLWTTQRLPSEKGELVACQPAS